MPEPHRPTPVRGFTLSFLSLWMSGWSLGVSFISTMLISGDLTFLLFAITHGGAEIGVGWLLAGQFASAAEAHARAPDITQDLDSMTAQWGGSSLRTTRLLVGFCLLGLLVGGLLLGGTWLPVSTEATPRRILIAALLSLAWSIIGWRWLHAIRRILRVQERITLKADIDRVTVTHRGLLVERTETFPAHTLQAEAEDDAPRLHLTSPTASATLICAPSPERTHLIHTLNEMARRAAASPAEAPPLPAALARLRGEHT